MSKCGKQPNVVAHMCDTTFEERLDAGDDAIHADRFRKSDGTIILPLWTGHADKTVLLTGLKAEPRVTDLFGNSIPLRYDDKTGVLDCLRVSQAPQYLGISPKIISCTWY